MSDVLAKVSALPWEQVNALRTLDGDAWLRPMDIGATDASPHSAWLRKFCAWGLVERQCRHAHPRRGAYVYRLTELGLAAVAQARGTSQEQPK